jgi:hypothetical protein
MPDAIDTWENEGGAVRRNQRPQPLAGEPAWEGAATADGPRVAFALPASLDLAGANRERRSCPSGAPELDGKSTRGGVVDGRAEID